MTFMIRTGNVSRCYLNVVEEERTIRTHGQQRQCVNRTNEREKRGRRCRSLNHSPFVSEGISHIRCRTSTGYIISAMITSREKFVLSFVVVLLTKVLFFSLHTSQEEALTMSSNNQQTGKSVRAYHSAPPPLVEDDDETQLTLASIVSLLFSSLGQMQS